MVNVHDYAHNLARALRDSQEHKAFLAAKEKLSGNESAKEMVSNFQKRQFEAHNAYMKGQELSDEKKEKLQQLYTIIQGNSVAREFLMAEQRMGMLMGDVYRIIREAVELEGPPGE